MQDLNDPAYRLLAYRWYPSATVMPDGRMLIASGEDQDGQDTGCATYLGTRACFKPWHCNISSVHRQSSPWGARDGVIICTGVGHDHASQ